MQLVVLDLLYICALKLSVGMFTQYACARWHKGVCTGEGGQVYLKAKLAPHIGISPDYDCVLSVLAQHPNLANKDPGGFPAGG